MNTFIFQSFYNSNDFCLYFTEYLKMREILIKLFSNNIQFNALNIHSINGILLISILLIVCYLTYILFSKENYVMI